MYGFFRDVVKLTSSAVGAYLVTNGVYNSTLSTVALAQDKYDLLAKQSPIFKLIPTDIATSQPVEAEPLERNKHILQDLKNGYFNIKTCLHNYAFNQTSRLILYSNTMQLVPGLHGKLGLNYDHLFDNGSTWTIEAGHEYANYFNAIAAYNPPLYMTKNKML